MKLYRSAILLLVLSGSMLQAQRAGEEIQYPGRDFAQLEAFESLNLQDADKLFAQGDHAGAYAAYKAFSIEFPRSRALPYVLLRTGRCLHLSRKRNAAIRAYQDVVDYFPDDVRYAAAALYFIGQCHGENGDTDRQTAAWARMVKDDDYVAEPNSGTALIHLANAMDQLKKYEEATEYRWRTAVNFVKTNEGAARDARNAVIHHYTLRRPDHDKLKEFFIATNAFADRHGNGDNPEEDKRYWHTVLDRAANGEDKERTARYWAVKFGDKFPDDDGMQLKLFSVQHVYEEDEDARLANIRGQFARVPASLARVKGWMGHFATPELQLDFVMEHAGPLMAEAALGERMDLIRHMRWHRDKVYEKHVAADVRGLKNEEKIWLMHQLRGAGLHEHAQSVLRQVSLAGMDDAGIRDVGMFAGAYVPEEEVLRTFVRMRDAVEATKARFDYYMGRTHNNKAMKEKALAEIPALKKSPTYAGQGLLWTEATLLRELGRFEEAITAYQAANRQPDSTWAVTDCLVALKRYDEAIRNVRGLESVGGEIAPQAALKVADIYKASGDKGREIDQLRLVLRRYPQSRQQSEAHIRLQRYDVALVGGVAVAEE